jgi:hypothetical protein
MGRFGGQAGAPDLSPTRKAFTNMKSTTAKRHTMSDWHRSTYNEESNFVKPGRLIVDRPLRTLEGDSRLASSSVSTSMSMTFSERIISPELMTPKVITNHSHRPPRHLDPRIRGWDMNTHPWWPNILQEANGPNPGGLPDESANERPASGSQNSRLGSAGGRRNSGRKKEKKEPRRAISAPLPVFVTPMPHTVTTHPKTAALRRQHEHLLKGTHLTVGDNAGRGERHDHDLHYSCFHKTDNRPAYRLLLRSSPRGPGGRSRVHL